MLGIGAVPDSPSDDTQTIQFDVKELPAPDIAHLKELADEIYELGVKKVELVTKGDRDTLKSTVFYAYEKYGEQVRRVMAGVCVLANFFNCGILTYPDGSQEFYCGVDKHV